MLLATRFSLTGQSVVNALPERYQTRSLPQSITTDKGTDFTSKTFDEWAWQQGIQLDFTRPGKPTDNGLIESFNGRLRDECLNAIEFVLIEDARDRIEASQQDYNAFRPTLTGQSAPQRVRPTRSESGWCRDFPASLANTGSGKLYGASKVANISARSRWMSVRMGRGRWSVGETMVIIGTISAAPSSPPMASSAISPPSAS